MSRSQNALRHPNYRVTGANTFQEYLAGVPLDQRGQTSVRAWREQRYQRRSTATRPLVRVEDQHLQPTWAVQQILSIAVVRNQPTGRRGARLHRQGGAVQIDTPLQVNACASTAAGERLANDRALRRLCGWESIRAIPSEATFSRAFAGFAEGACRAEPSARGADREHHAGAVGRSCVTRCHGDRGAREADSEANAASQAEAQASGAHARARNGRPAPEPSRLQRQQQMTLPEMLQTTCPTPVM